MRSHLRKNCNKNANQIVHLQRRLSVRVKDGAVSLLPDQQQEIHKFVELFPVEPTQDSQLRLGSQGGELNPVHAALGTAEYLDDEVSNPAGVGKPPTIIFLPSIIHSYLSFWSINSSTRSSSSLESGDSSGVEREPNTRTQSRIAACLKQF